MLIGHNLSKSVLTINLPQSDGTTFGAVAGTTVITFKGVDTLGFKTIQFCLILGVITSGAATSAKCQSSSDDGSVDTYSDIAGSNVTILDTDDNTVVLIEINDPQERYINLVVSRATQNAVLIGCIARLANASNVPITQHASVTHTNVLNSPKNGTA